MDAAIDTGALARPVALRDAFPPSFPEDDFQDSDLDAVDAPDAPPLLSASHDDICIRPVLFGGPEDTPDHVFEAQLIEHKRLFEVMLMLRHDIEASARAIAGCLAAGRKVILCCDVESIPEAQRLAAHLTARMVGRSHGIAAIALLPDQASGMRSPGGDAAQDMHQARQLHDMGHEGDCLLAISASGDSRMLVNAVKAARRGGMATMSLTGGDGPLTRICDQVMAVPASSPARIQEAHLFLIHALCALVETHLKP